MDVTRPTSRAGPRCNECDLPLGVRAGNAFPRHVRTALPQAVILSDTGECGTGCCA
jgi:hypothetical protein